MNLFFPVWYHYRRVHGVTPVSLGYGGQELCPQEKAARTKAGHRSTPGGKDWQMEGSSQPQRAGGLEKAKRRVQWALWAGSVVLVLPTGP